MPVLLPRTTRSDCCSCGFTVGKYESSSLVLSVRLPPVPGAMTFHAHVIFCSIPAGVVESSDLFVCGHLNNIVLQSVSVGRLFI